MSLAWTGTETPRATASARRCPFGSCRSKKTECFESTTEDHGEGWQVYCRSCGAAGPHKRTEAAAIAAWNSVGRVF